MLQIVLAMMLGSLLVINLFDLFTVTNYVSIQQTALLDMEDNLRLMNYYLRKKIHMAGSLLCANNIESKQKTALQVLTPSQARDQYGVTAKAQSDILLLRECVHIDGADKYLPILFYVGESARQRLFYQIDHHPREMLINGVKKFHVQIDAKKLVVIRYQLESSMKIFMGDRYSFLSQNGVIYAMSKII